MNDLAKAGELTNAIMIATLWLLIFFLPSYIVEELRSEKVDLIGVLSFIMMTAWILTMIFSDMKYFHFGPTVCFVIMNVFIGMMYKLNPYLYQDCLCKDAFKMSLVLIIYQLLLIPFRGVKEADIKRRWT